MLGARGGSTKVAYNARVFQVFIASPGDVQDERKIVAEIIHEWNYLNSRDRGIVLLPLRWETHSSPEMGSPPQTVINRQVADYADLVVGVFWTRLGTPTADAESGTAEEVARAGDAEKTVMLYFSKAKVDISEVDLDEYGRLQDFKRKKFPEGLIEQYSSLGEFRDKFSKQLAMKIRDLVAKDSNQLEGERKLAAPSVTLAVAQGNPPQVLSSPVVLHVADVICTDEDEIPDNVSKYISSEEGTSSWGSVSTGIGAGAVTVSASPNKDYYRELVHYFRQRLRYQALRLAVANLGDDGVRDLYLEFRVSGTAAGLDLLPPDKLMPVPSSYFSGVGGVGTMFQVPAPTSGIVQIGEKVNDSWQMSLELPVVQAGRRVVSRNEVCLGATEPVTAILEATAYSSTSMPFSLELRIELQVEQNNLSYREILKQLGIDLAGDERTR
jgi:hypothetical protein